MGWILHLLHLHWHCHIPLPRKPALLLAERTRLCRVCPDFLVYLFEIRKLAKKAVLTPCTESIRLNLPRVWQS